MKGFVLCLFLAVGGLNARNVELSPAAKEKVNQNTMECAKEIGMKPEVIAEIKKGNINESDDVKKFTLCFFKKLGVLSPDGKLNVEAALEKLPSGVDTAEAKMVLEACKDKKGATPEDTAFEIYKCYHRDIKTHIVM